MTLHEVFAAAMKLSDNDQRRLIEMIRAEIQASFRPGERVSFIDKRGQVVIGIIDRVNQKSVSLHEADRPTHRWKVSPQLLTKEAA